MRRMVTKLNFFSFAIIGLAALTYSQEEDSENEEYQYEEYSDQSGSGEEDEYYYDTLQTDTMTRMMSDVYEFDGVVDYGTTDYTVNDEFDSPELDLEGNVEYPDAYMNMTRVTGVTRK